MPGPSHKTYPLLRYMPTYVGLPAAMLPPLIIVSAIFMAMFGLMGAIPVLVLAVALRALYLWNPDSIAMLRGALGAISFIDRHMRLRP